MVQCFGLCIVYCVFLVAGSAVQFCFDSDIHRRTDGKRRVNERVRERERECDDKRSLAIWREEYSRTADSFEPELNGDRERWWRKKKKKTSLAQPHVDTHAQCIYTSTEWNILANLIEWSKFIISIITFRELHFSMSVDCCRFSLLLFFKYPLQQVIANWDLWL